MTLRDEEVSVTVITPTLNQASYLVETLESIHRQTQKGIEHIVVDDGSTDDTPKLLAAWADNRNRDDYSFVHVSQSKSGEATAVNVGWRRARGRLVTVVSSDDPQPANWLALCANSLQQNPDRVAAYPDWNVIDAKGVILRRVVVPPYSRDGLIARVRCLPGPGTVIRRSMVPITELRRETLSYVSDYDCWLRLSLIGDFIHVPTAVANWRQHDAGLSARMDSAARAEELKKVLEDFFAMNLPEEIGKMRSVAMANAAYECGRTLWRRHPFKAATYFARSVRVLPQRIRERVFS